MAEETLRPNAAGDNSGLTAVGDTPNYECVDEVTTDEMTTYVKRTYHSAAYTLDVYNLPAHSGSGIINSVTVYARCRKNKDTGYAKIACKTHSTVYYGSEETMTTSWVTYSKEWTTNPNTSSAWTWAEIDALQIGESLKYIYSGPPSSVNGTYCTQVYVVVDYTDVSTYTRTFTTDARLVNRHTKTFSTDAFLVDRYTKTATTDARLVNRHTKSFTVDALLVNRHTKTLTVDVYLLKTGTKTFSTNAIVTGSIEGITRDSVGIPLGGCTVWLFKTSDKSHVDTTTSNGSGEYVFDGISNTDNHFIRAFKDGAPNVFGVTDDDLNAPSTTDIYLYDGHSTPEDVILRFAGELSNLKTFECDASVVNRHTKTFINDAILTKTTTKAFTCDAQIGANYKSFDADAILRKTDTKTYAVDGQIVGVATKTFSSDAVILKKGLKEFSLDAVLFGTATKGFTVNAILRRKGSRTFTADSRLTNRYTKPFSTDAIIRYGSKSFIADGLLSATNTKELTVDAELAHVKQFAVNAIVGEPWAPSRGFYYSKLGTDNLHNPPKTFFTITTELNNIASFDYVIQNDAHNRDIIANNLTEDFRIMRDDGTELLRASIDSDSIEYFTEGEGRGRRRIRLSGFANFVDLKYLIYKRMAAGDAENVGSVQDEDNSTSTFTDYTTEANNATMDDVLLTFGAVDDALYIGKDETFFATKIKYSTKGIQAANTTVVMEYSKGSGVWATLDCIDESYSFTKDAGTYLLYIPNKADDWVKDTINGKNQYHIRFRLTEGSYTLSPKLDQIKLSNADVCRVQFNDTPADTILDYLLEDTGYTEDATDQCPSTEITIRGEYDSKLRWIFGLGSALTWEDGNGDMKRYDCWIDTAKKVHYKQHRGTDQGDISADFRALSNKIGYGEMGTRIFGTGGQEGINQKKAIVEDLTAQGEHKLREIVLEDNRITAYEAVKEEALKSLANRKNPLKDVTGDLDTKYWLDNTMDVGDKILVHQPDWNLNNQELYVMRAVIGPSLTQLDLGNSQIHLEHLRSTLQRQMDIGNVWMHGSVSTYVAGPEEDNYERKDDTTAYPLRFTIEVPDNARGINHVEIGWELMDYKSSVDGSGPGGGHSHTSGPSSRTGAHDHTTGPSAGGGAHDHNTGSDGDHEHVITSSGIHWHTVDGTITTQSDTAITSVNMNDAGGHSHTNPTTSGPSGTTTVLTGLNFGSPCTPSGHCVVDGTGTHVASSGHTHTQGSTGYEADHHHPMGGTQAYFIYNIADITGWTSSQHDGHDHPESTEGNHWHATDTASAHTHTIPNTNTEDDHEHTIPESSTETDHEHPIAYGVHEIPGGTTLELYVGDELVGDTYVGDQSGINITGFISTGSNSITLKPITTDHVKGRAKMSAMVTVFLENLK